jgi:DNA-binding MarR family transcriptional regulator
MFTDNQTILARESAEYLEILADIFAEIVRRGTTAREVHKDSEITPALVQCLQYIYLHGPSPIRKIASGLSITIPAVSQLVDRLVRKNLVTREHCMEDRRLASVELTAEGRVIVEEVRSARTAWLRDILCKMPEDKRSELVESLEEFIRLSLEAGGNIDDACVRCGIDHLAFCVVNKARMNATGEQIKEY